MSGNARRVARPCRKCGRYVAIGKRECPFCAPPPSQPTFEDWCRCWGIILVPPLPPGEVPAPASPDALRSQLALPGAAGPGSDAASTARVIDATRGAELAGCLSTGVERQLTQRPASRPIHVTSGRSGRARTNQVRAPTLPEIGRHLGPPRRERRSRVPADLEGGF
jgi:hypothetical protein